LAPLEPLPHLWYGGEFPLHALREECPSPEAERALDTYLVLLSGSFVQRLDVCRARHRVDPQADIYAAATSAIATLEGRSARRGAESRDGT
jgi:citrate synthase